VYFVLAPKKVQYPTGQSRVVYIGVTENPATRFNGHQQVRPGDEVRLLSLVRALQQVKGNDPRWRADHPHSRLVREAERIYIYAFWQTFGRKPIRNTQARRPTREAMLAVEILFPYLRDRAIEGTPLVTETDRGRALGSNSRDSASIVRSL
jgi:hypothetical protein